MSLALSNLVGDASGWMGGVAQASTPSTDLSPHVDGGQSAVSAVSANSRADDTARGTMYSAVGIVLTGLALLFLMGAFAFKGHNS